MDASYEGDLMPVVGASYRLGRESREEFQEPHAGIMFMKSGGGKETGDGAASRKALNLRYFGHSDVLLEKESTGAADGNIQAFNFRTVLSSDPENRILPEKPEGYDPALYKDLEYSSMVEGVPGRKVVWNRPQLIGLQTDYVKGGWDRREEVMDRHWEATVGLLWHLQNHESVPEKTRNDWKRYGLARDEFPGNGGRPHEIYVREGRRLDGRYMITEHDLVLAEGLPRAPVHADSVAFTDWYMDSHACTDVKIAGSKHEGKHTLHEETRPGHIPWRAFLPKELDNLIVPVGLSSTHVAWGAIRLEPAWMHTGEVAGFAAALAKELGIKPGKLDVADLQRRLVDRRVTLDFLNDVDASGDAPWIPAAHYFSVRGFFPTYDAAPTAPLDERVAVEWLKEAELLQRGEGDAMKIARRLWDIRKDPNTVHQALLGRDFLKQALEKARSVLRDRMKTSGLRDDSPLSRGDALLLLYRWLEHPAHP